MELAIPIIALGGLYMASKNENKCASDPAQEGFQSASQNALPLPNTDIPNQNFPQEFPVESAEIEQTSKLSTINKYDTPSTYTDKYFNTLIYPETSSANAFTSMTGERVNAEYFQHNNMTPFFGAKQRSQIQEYSATEGILDTYSGSGTQFVTKEEQSPLFAPDENYQHAYGPNQKYSRGLENLDVEIGDNFSGSLNHLIDVASQKNSTTTTTTTVSAEDRTTTKSEKLSKQACESFLDELRTKRRRIGQRVRELKHEHAALIRQLEHIRAQRENMQNQVHIKTTTLQGEILNTQLRHDTAMCHCLTATTVCLMLEIERALKQNDNASLEQIARFGLLMHQESLLSCYDKEEGMLQDQLSATFSLDGVVFLLRRGSKKKGMKTRGEIGDSITIRRLPHRYSLRVFEKDEPTKEDKELNRNVFTVLGGVVMEHRQGDEKEGESFEFTLPTAFDLCLEPLHKLEIEIEIPPDMYVVISSEIPL